MSKVISFSISDRYLDKIRSLYPHLTDNLAAKQFLTDRLDSSLSSSLDDSLDGILDDKVKTLIESWVDGLLEVRLDDAVKKSITSLSERLSRLESRLDDSLDGRLDDMELLLRMQREASIANPPDLTSIDGSVETANPSPPDLPPDRPATAIETLSTVEDADTVETANEPVSTVETVTDAIETSSPDLPPSPPSPALDAIASIDGTVEDADSVEPDSTVETGEDAIDLTNKEKAAILGIHDSNLSKWLRKGIIPDKYLNKCQFNENKSKIKFHSRQKSLK